MRIKAALDPPALDLLQRRHRFSQLFFEQLHEPSVATCSTAVPAPPVPSGPKPSCQTTTAPGSEGFKESRGGPFRSSPNTPNTPTAFLVVFVEIFFIHTSDTPPCPIFIHAFRHELGRCSRFHRRPGTAAATGPPVAATEPA